MTRVFFDGRDLEIAIRHQGVEHVYPLTSLAAVLRVETAFLRARITALLKAREHLSTDAPVLSHPVAPDASGILSGEPTEGTVPFRSDTVQQETDLNRSDTIIGTVQAMVASNNRGEASPEFIARQLGDVPNTGAIAVLIRDVPSSLISAALHQALAVPGTRLRTNRAALFTAIVRRMHCGGAQSSRPHARTPSSST